MVMLLDGNTELVCYVCIQVLRKELKHEGVLYKVTFSEEDLDSPPEVPFENVDIPLAV